MNDVEKAWIRGFCTALAEMHRLRMMLSGGYSSSGVCDVAKAASVSLRKAREAGVAGWDLAELAKAGVPDSAE
jgi:hypothetical protein